MITTFVGVMSFTSIDLIAGELEMPFGDDVNDFPVHEQQLQMNRDLVALLRPAAWDVPKLQAEAVTEFRHLAMSDINRESLMEFGDRCGGKAGELLHCVVQEEKQHEPQSPRRVEEKAFDTEEKASPAAKEGAVKQLGGRAEMTKAGLPAERTLELLQGLMQHLEKQGLTCEQLQQRLQKQEAVHEDVVGALQQVTCRLERLSTVGPRPPTLLPTSDFAVSGADSRGLGKSPIPPEASTCCRPTLAGTTEQVRSERSTGRSKQGK